MADNPTAAPQGDGAPQGAGFSIERIYIKDLSLENPGRAAVVPAHRAAAGRGRHAHARRTDRADVYEFVLTLTVTATIAGKTLFLVETSQAGVFTIRGVPPDQLQPVMAINCPNVLFPYARETIADATMRAGFPPVHLAPINFEVLYQQQMAQQQPCPRSRTDGSSR